MIEGDRARQRLLDKQKMQEANFQKNLEELIEKTSKHSALKAMNLDQLLKKKWSEEKNAYMIMTKIQSEDQKRRLNNLSLIHI